MIQNSFKFLTITLVISVWGCSWVQSLRSQVRDDDNPLRERKLARNPAAKFIPPPATVEDNKLQVLSGTPVDLSGTRAKVRLTRADWDAENLKNENSLWSEDGQTNYLFARNQLKMPGDLITVVIEDDLRKDMVDKFKYLLPPEYRKRKYRVPGLSKEKDDSTGGRQVASAAPAEGGEANAQAQQDLASEDQVTAEVLERFPNGNLRIRAVKRVPFRKKVRDVEVTAIVKNSEISEQDIVRSSKFYEHKVELYQ